MAATVTPGLAYARSCTALVTCDGAANVVPNAELLKAASTTGSLRTLLSTTYATAGDLQSAFRNAGGILAFRLSAGTAITTSQWTLDGAVPPLPTVTFAAGDATTRLEMDITLFHTVSA